MGGYVCPTCGEKTLWVKSSAPLVEGTVYQCRRLLSEVTGLGLRLDESAFCARCQPGVNEPHLALEITFADDSNPRRVAPVKTEDIQFLSEFLKGKLVHQAPFGKQEPLRGAVGRLEMLLGVQKEKPR
jgi:hypothetical protein